MVSKKGEQTRQAIIDKSKELFLSEGYEKTTYRMIGRELGINSNLVSYYFNSKNNLGHEILKDYYVEEDNKVGALIPQEHSPMLEYVVHNRVHYRVLAANPPIFRFYYELVGFGYLHNFITDISPVNNMYRSFFTYYGLPQKYPFEYYSAIESGAEIEILKMFTPSMAEEESFYECFATVFPRFIGVPEEEISECLRKGGQMCESLDFSDFHF